MKGLLKDDGLLIRGDHPLRVLTPNPTYFLCQFIKWVPPCPKQPFITPLLPETNKTLVPSSNPKNITNHFLML